jgi:hypothetical protein
MPPDAQRHAVTFLPEVAGEEDYDVSSCIIKFEKGPADGKSFVMVYISKSSMGLNEIK